MTLSHTVQPDPRDVAVKSNPKRRRVLVTGAAGNIGSYFAEHSHRRYDLRLMVQDPADAPELEPYGEVVQGDLNDLQGLERLCHGIDTVVHLAGNPSPTATWESLSRDNITGTYHLFVAARAAGVRRVIYASSIHAVSGYPADMQVKTSEPVNPGDLYGVSKCFGEALARYMAEQENVSTICLRIGAFQPPESARSKDGISMLDAWVSQRDLQQLIEKCIDAPDDLRFALLHAISDNRFKRLDISDARELVGYDPQDDLTEINPQLRGLSLKDKVQSHSAMTGPEKSGLREDLKELKADPKSPAKETPGRRRKGGRG